MFNSNIFGRIFQHVFIITTGFAALLHSTWSISTLFNGHEPNGINWQWLLWVIPGFAFAFSIDVGQIAISVDLRSGERTRWKYITFIALALTTYYFQWTYMVAHVPLIETAPGVAAEFVGATYWMRAISIWLVPALLPLATTLYTFSYSKVKPARNAKALPGANVTAVVPVAKPAVNFTIENPHEYVATCDVCGATVGAYKNPRSASAAVSAHKRHHHSAEQLISSNGRHE